MLNELVFFKSRPKGPGRKKLAHPAERIAKAKDKQS